MKITVNGKEESIEEGITIEAYLETKGIRPSLVIVEYNYEVADRAMWKSIFLKENDNIEIVKFIGGG